LKRLIGEEEYARLASMARAKKALVLEYGGTATTLVLEINSIMNSISSAMSDMNAAQEVAKNAKQSVNVAKSCLQAAENECFLVQWFSNDVANAKEKLKLAENAYEQANAIKLDTKSLFEQARSASLSYKDALKGGACGLAIVVALEMAVHTGQFAMGRISGSQWMARMGSSIVRNGVTFVASTAITTGMSKISIMIGAALGGPMGATIGAVSGFLLSMYISYKFSTKTGKIIDEWFDEFFATKTDEQTARDKVLKEALNHFHFEEKDIFDADEFNLDILNKRWKRYCLEAHPDRRNGNYEKWNRLSMYYGALEALAGEMKTNPNDAKKCVNRVMKLEYR